MKHGESGLMRKVLVFVHAIVQFQSVCFSSKWQAVHAEAITFTCICHF